MVRLFGREDRRREQLLSAYVDGEVTAEEAREVEELLASSEDARRELAELQATVDLVRGCLNWSCHAPSRWTQRRRNGGHCGGRPYE